ncbi:MAG: mannonate dehydratase, partial [Candidatus Latescibacteria bacterium]|nr:mannonate dehydratase [Candidatus Latescibacterota bacterium]
HPDDPPIPSFEGVAQIIVDWHALQRVIDTVPSPCNGLGFCMGTIGTMAEVDVVEAIRHFGGQGEDLLCPLSQPAGTRAQVRRGLP